MRDKEVKMKKIKIILFTIVVLLPVSLSAQFDEIGYFSNKPQDNWFISVGGGIQLYYGTEDFTYINQNNIAPAVDLSFGKWIVPSLAFRVQFAGLQGYGWSTVLSPYMETVPINNLYQEKFFYLNSRVDFLWNVLDIGNHYRASRIFKFIPFVGVGAAATFKDTLSLEVSPSATAGFLFMFRISEHVNLHLELRSTFADGRLDKMYCTYDEDKLDIVKLAPAVEIMNTASIGITIDLMPRKFSRRYEMSADYRYRLKELQGNYLELQKKKESSDNKIDELNKRIYELIKENDDLIRQH